MRFELTDDQQAIQQTAREFLASRYPVEEVRRLALEDERGFTDEQWRAIAELGWPALVVPEDDGGLGLGVVELTVLQEQLGYALAPTPLLSTIAGALAGPITEMVTRSVASTSTARPIRYIPRCLATRSAPSASARSHTSSASMRRTRRSDCRWPLRSRSAA